MPLVFLLAFYAIDHIFLGQIRELNIEHMVLWFHSHPVHQSETVVLKEHSHQANNCSIPSPQPLIPIYIYYIYLYMKLPGAEHYLDEDTFRSTFLFHQYPKLLLIFKL